jgi:hypothetical protein
MEAKFIDTLKLLIIALVIVSKRLDFATFLADSRYVNCCSINWMNEETGGA